MNIDEKYSTIREQYYKAFNEMAHAQTQIETLIGERLRAHQKVILSVLIKENGRTSEYFDEVNYIKGTGAWAVATRKGFEVIALEEKSIVIRSVSSPEISQKSVTYKIPRDIMMKSNREIAKELRDSIKIVKDREKSWRAYENTKKLKKLEQALARAEKDLENMRSKKEKLENLAKAQNKNAKANKQTTAG